MADYNLSPVFQDAQFDSDVLPLVGGTLTWYLAGTTTPATVYQTSIGTAHTAPIVLTARGEPPAPIWLANGTAYKCVLKDASAVTIRTIDDIIGVGDTTVFPSEFTEVTIDSTGNGAKIWQDADGNLAFQTNQGSGTQNNVSLSYAKTASDKPITTPKLRIGDTTVPTLPLEVVGNGYLNGALRVGDTTTPTQKLEVAGSATVTGDVSPGGLGAIRYRLAADRTYYVRTDGSDSNNGLADTAGGAFRTIQHAIDVVAMLDIAYQQVTIQIRSGTYAGFVLRSLMTAAPGGYSVTIVGDTATPGNVLITGSGVAVTGDNYRGGYRIRGMKFVSTGSVGVMIYSAWLQMDLVEFGACLTHHIVSSRGAVVNLTGNYTISGSSGMHAYADVGGVIYATGITVSVSGTPAFSGYFAVAAVCGSIYMFSMTFSGSATGARYSATLNGVIYTNGVTLPGSVAGTTATGGQYA